MALANILRLPAPPPAMASRWRRRVACTVIGERAFPALLIDLSGRWATVEADGPVFGQSVTLAHPVAGRINAIVGARNAQGLRLHLLGDAEAAGFAMAAIAADMTRPS